MAAAMVLHMGSFALASAQDPRFRGIGGEGWYLDVLRPAEAVLIAWLVTMAVRRTGLAGSGALG